MAPSTRSLPTRAIGRALAVLSSALVLALAIGPAANAAAPVVSPSMRPVCGTPAAGHVRCHALLRTDIASSGHAIAAYRMTAGVQPAVAALYSANLQAAYGLTAAAASSGVGATVAVIDAMDDPTAESDLGVYRAHENLPSCTTANGCFRKVDQNGGTNYPAADANWSTEIALDLDMVSAICPNCSLLLVEANSTSISDLGTAVNRAVAMGATYISNSYGTSIEYSSELTWDTQYYKHPGLVLTASTGDYGYGASYPAASPYVVAVGGTSLSWNGSAWQQAAWSGAGSGCSQYEPKPSWQHDTGCAKRTMADVSAVADTATPVAVYDAGSWVYAGGTSASAPIVAAAYALAGTPPAGGYPGSYPYLRGGLTDVTGGGNGSCGAVGSSTYYLCNGVAGYDGPTGLGTPAGTAPFTAPTLPGAPTGVTAAPGNASATVTWTAPASNGGAAITSYTATSSSGKTCIGTDPGTGCVVTGLVNGTPYTFTVTATSPVGTGPASAPSSSVTPRSVAGQPTGVTAIPGNAQAQVSWSAPTNDGGAAITGYTATASPGGATCTVAAPALSCTVAGLANGQAYTFSVTATNAAGPGPASLASAPVTPFTVPDPPTGVTGVPGNGSVSVSWTAGFNGGSPVTGYTVTASPGGQTCSWTSGLLECGVTGLANGTAYTFTVTAANVAGSGSPSAPSAPVTPISLPGQPTNVTVALNAVVKTGVDVTWTAPVDDGGSPVLTYTATAYDATALAAGRLVAVGMTCHPAPAEPTTCTINGLTPGTTVVARVTATTAVGTGLPSAPSAPVAIPVVAPAVAFAGPSLWTVGTSARLDWSPTAGSYPIASYRVAYRRLAWNGTAWVSGTLGASAASTTVALPAGTSTCFRVQAVDSEGNASAWSAERCTTTPIDDRGLVRRGSWSIGTSSSTYLNTWTRSSSYGASVTRTSVRARRIVLVASTCPTCGTVRVYLGSTLLKTISLRSSVAGPRRVFTIATWSTVHTGTVTVKLSTSGRSVLIDGLGVSVM